MFPSSRFHLNNSHENYFEPGCFSQIHQKTTITQLEKRKVKIRTDEKLSTESFHKSFDSISSRTVLLFSFCFGIISSFNWSWSFLSFSSFNCRLNCFSRFSDSTSNPCISSIRLSWSEQLFMELLFDITKSWIEIRNNLPKAKFHSLLNLFQN